MSNQALEQTQKAAPPSFFVPMTETKYISERIWWCSDLPERDDGRQTLKRLIEIEHPAGQLPDWAVSIAENNINYFPPCGHEMFQYNVDAILEAIKKHKEVQGFFYCFMVSGEALAKAQQVVEKSIKNLTKEST